MDTQTTQEDKEILEIFKSLPQIIQDAITKSGWEVILRGIVSKYHLRIDQGTKLENMTFALMMGVMEPKEYFDLIHNDFGLDTEGADSLFQDIDEKIFSRIEEMTRKLEEEKKEPDQQTFVKEDREVSSKDDEILTLTREEILKDIEDPQQNKAEDNLPDLEDSVVMPKTKEEVKLKTEVPDTAVSPDINKNVEIREEQIPSNLPQENIVPIKKEEPKFDNTKPLNPIDINLNKTVSASNKSYQTVDPYREKIE